MSNNNYNYDIEHTFAKYGGEIALKEEKRHAITHADMVQLETEAINKKEQDQQ